MTILLLFIALFVGMYIGAYFMYKRDKKFIDDLEKRCTEANERLDVMIRDEEKFLSTMWPKYNSLGDYMKAKRDNENLDCDDIYE